MGSWHQQARGEDTEDRHVQPPPRALHARKLSTRSCAVPRPAPPTRRSPQPAVLCCFSVLRLLDPVCDLHIMTGCPGSQGMLCLWEATWCRPRCIPLSSHYSIYGAPPECPVDQKQTHACPHGPSHSGGRRPLRKHLTDALGHRGGSREAPDRPRHIEQLI